MNMGLKRSYTTVYLPSIMVKLFFSTIIFNFFHSLQDNISEEDWEMACLKAQKHSINTKLKSLQYKWLMRVYITPVKLNHISPNIPDICVKNNQKGTLIRCL